MTTITIEVEANLQWIAKQAERTGCYIAVCDPLGIAIEAENEAELHSLMEEAVSLLLADLFADNELDEFLRAQGWTAPKLPDRQSRDVTFRVPMELVMAARKNGQQQHAH